MEWTDIRLTVAKADADNAEAVATMIAEGRQCPGAAPCRLVNPGGFTFP